jgi:K+-transporting ATPase A subunit
MTLNGWIQISIYFVLLTVLAVPLGRLMAQVFEGERTFLMLFSRRSSARCTGSPASTRRVNKLGSRKR